MISFTYLALFLIVSIIYWGCSAPLTKLLGVPEHLQPPPSYAYGALDTEITAMVILVKAGQTPFIVLYQPLL